MTNAPRPRRRDILRGLGAGTLLLGPYLRSTRAFAQGSRPGAGNFLFFFTPNGFVRRTLGSDGSDAAFKLRYGLELAEPMKDHISTVRGLCWKSQQGAKPFHDQLPNLLTCVSGPDRQIGYGPSIDHVVGKLTDRPPLTTEVYVYSDPAFFTRLSWRDKGVHDAPLRSPMEAYQAAFGRMTPTGNADEVKLLLAQERSVLDHLREDITLFRGRVGPADRNRLDAHLDALRQLERRLADVAPLAAGGLCKPDAAKAASTVGRRPREKDLKEFKLHGDLTTDVIATAFACGLRNAATMFWQSPGGGLNPNGGLGRAGNHHHVSHNEAPKQVWSDIDRWYGKQFGETLQKLQAIGILDRTVVVWGSDIAEYHSHNNCTFVVGGGRSLGIRHRKTIALPFHGNEMGARSVAQDERNASLSDLWLSVLKACDGGKAQKFGEYSTGGIPGLWAPV